MSIELDFTGLIVFRRRFLPSAPLAVADIDSLATGIVAYIVGVIAVVEGFESRVRTSIKYPNASILCVCNV